jgi:hypothetical protein
LLARKQKGRFCGHFSRVMISDFRSLPGDIVFRHLLARQSPAAKNPVPNSKRASKVIGLQARPYNYALERRIDDGPGRQSIRGRFSRSVNRLGFMVHPFR